MLAAIQNPVYEVGSDRADSIAVLGLLLALVQVIDGLFTISGISSFGLEAEGNTLVRMLMEQYGVVTAIVMVKSFALLLTVLLCLCGLSVKWVEAAMKGVIAFYLLMAVAPWAYLHVAFIL